MTSSASLAHSDDPIDRSVWIGLISQHESHLVQCGHACASPDDRLFGRVHSPISNLSVDIEAPPSVTSMIERAHIAAFVASR